MHLVKLVINISVHQLYEALCLLVPLLDQSLIPLEVLRCILSLWGERRGLAWPGHEGGHGWGDS